MSVAKQNGAEEQIMMKLKNKIIRLVSEGEEQEYTRHRANVTGKSEANR